MISEDTSMREALVKDESGLLSIENLKMYFPIYGGVFRRQVATVKALDGISFLIKKGETLGVVGESGCGKSTMGRTIIRLSEPTSGNMWFRTRAGDVVNLSELDRNEMRPIRAEIQMIFQDPFSSLNPRMTVGDIIMEPMALHLPQLGRKQRWTRSIELLERVGLSEKQAFRYPHEFSGGQRQRIGIARALSTNPRLIIADEPVSALDVSIQAQVVNLMQDLQKEFGLTYIFIAHDLAIVEHISDRIAVMYLGNMAEAADSRELYENPRHPYTRALLSAIPVADPRYKKPGRIILQGDVPSPVKKPSGCGFRTRCQIAQPDCSEKVPTLVSTEKIKHADNSDTKSMHFVACPHAARWNELISKSVQGMNQGSTDTKAQTEPASP